MPTKSPTANVLPTIVRRSHFWQVANMPAYHILMYVCNSDVNPHPIDPDPGLALWNIQKKIERKIYNAPKKWLIILCMSLLFKYVKQKCNFYYKKLFMVIWSIFMWVSHEFLRILCYSDPDDFYRSRSGSMSLHWYWLVLCLSLTGTITLGFPFIQENHVIFYTLSIQKRG